MEVEGMARLVRLYGERSKPPYVGEPHYLLYAMSRLSLERFRLRWMKADDGADALFIIEDPMEDGEAEERARSGDYLDFTPNLERQAGYEGYRLAWAEWARKVEPRAAKGHA